MFQLLTAVAIAGTVQVNGVGEISVTQATVACLQTQALEPDGPRTPVFQSVAKGMLGRSAEERVAYFRTKPGQPWPTDGLEVNQSPEFPWHPAGAIPACTALGVHWLEAGAALYGACKEKKSLCKAKSDKDEFEVVWDLVKQIELDETAGPDALFVGLRRVQPPMKTWRDPMTYLLKACEGPQQAADKGHALDTNDLADARRACLQLISLAEEAPPTRVDVLECNTPWADTSAVAPSLVQVKETSVGMKVRMGEGKRTEIRRRLAAMDPSPGVCKATGWAEVWRGDLMKAWRKGIADVACPDEGMPLDTRALLCPRLALDKRTKCAMGESAGCMMVAKMLIEGVRVEVDLPAGVELYEKACKLSEQAGCNGVRTRAADIVTWFGQALEGARPLPPEPPPVVEEDPENPAPEPKKKDEEELEESPKMPETYADSMEKARGFIDLYSGTIGQPWATPLVQRLVQAAVDAWDNPRVKALKVAYPDAMTPEFLAPVDERLAEIEETLLKRAERAAEIKAEMEKELEKEKREANQ